MNVSYKDFKNICRLCLSNLELTACALQKNAVQLLDKLGFQREVNELHCLPEKICCQCEEKIENILSFIDQCKKNYNILKSILLDKKKVKLFHDIGADLGADEFDDQKEDIDITNNDPQADEDITSDKNSTEENSKYKHPVHYNTVRFQARKAKIICKKCDLIFDSKLSLGTHYMKNIECRPLSFKLYKCGYCIKEFLRFRDRMDHENIHTQITPYNCEYCPQKFKFRTNLHRHIYRHKQKLSLVENNTENKGQLMLRCDKCEKVFSSRSGFYRHKLKHEGKVPFKKYKLKCDKNRNHFLCNFCAMSFYIKANLVAHLRVHTGERPFKCSQCEQQFKQKSVLNRHTLNHLDVRPKPFVCDVCQKTFTTNSNMKIHTRLHTGEKPYECNFCKKCFTYKTRWKIHLRIHTGESPFVCSICSNSYHDKGSLKKHQKTKDHMPKEEKTLIKQQILK